MSAAVIKNQIEEPIMVSIVPYSREKIIAPYFEGYIALGVDNITIQKGDCLVQP